ncbi:MAG: NAD-dependent epimerase/dehydratase family protein [Solobacterium sp.]|jgi:nucleoside-diphosphate-sugar epimerase|nr:NAD-dependent epimerase/dehydratase family protein [Solobacterium sp.]
MDKKSVLMIGGTGTISMSITRLLAASSDVEVTVLNRGSKALPEGAVQLISDINDTAHMKEILQGRSFDAVCDFLIYTPEQAEQRIALFQGITKQFIYISTVCVFDHEDIFLLNEGSLQNNRYSEYGRNKSAAEKVFIRANQEQGFPVTIVRPSQTYGYDRIPLSVKGKTCWSVIDRILNDRQVIVHGDGKAIWHSMHTEDFAYNFRQLLFKEETLGHSINLVNPECATWDMIYYELYRQLGKEPRIVHLSSETIAASSRYDNTSAILGDKQYSNIYDPHRMMEYIPDFQCNISLEQGIGKYLNYMNQHEELKQKDPVFDLWCLGMINALDSCRDAVEEMY